MWMLQLAWWSPDFRLNLRTHRAQSRTAPMDAAALPLLDGVNGNAYSAHDTRRVSMPLSAYKTSLASLKKIKVAPTARPDFDAFWKRRQSQVKQLPLALSSQRIATPLTRLTFEHVQFDGIDGTRLHARKIVPNPLPPGKLPFLVHFHGYTGYGGRPFVFAPWASMNIGVLTVDARLQGGDTGSARGFDSSACIRVGTMGILDENDYYLDRHYTDSMRAVEAARSLPEADPERIVIEGSS
jgi:cephalosporin-C deacetylase